MVILGTYADVFPTETCRIKRNVDGHTDENTGKWVKAQEVIVAIGEFDIQSKGGRERATSLQTDYESDYKGFADVEDIIFEPNYSEIKKGDILIDASGKKYTIVYPGKWDDHYEPDLKES